MNNVTAKTWIGLLINLLALIMGLYSMGEKYQWDSFTTGFAVVMSLAFLTALAGVVMLIRGNPAGGIVGAVGSAFFIPIGLICVMGCIQSRDKIRFADYAPGTPATPAPVALSAQMPPAAETPAHDTAGEVMTGETAAEEAKHVESAPVEKPLVAYAFPDERPMGWLVLVLGVGAGFFLLSSGGSLSGVTALIVVGIIKIIRGNLRVNAHVYALYSEYLECVSGQFSGSIRNPLCRYS